MNADKKKEIWKIIINALLAIFTALTAASCTLAAMGHTPFRSLVD